MPSLLSGYAYDVFVSYRHNDNQDGWVTTFVEHLQRELKSILKEEINIYFDSNPHDGLLESHNVDKSLERKLKCLILLPIVSQTYCDTKAFAWQNELVPFFKWAQSDGPGLNVQLADGNFGNRILPVRIHDLDPEDTELFEQATEERMRSIDFVYKAKGVNRPLQPEDVSSDNEYHTVYRDQVNKVAHAIKQLVRGMSVSQAQPNATESQPSSLPPANEQNGFWDQLKRRQVPSAVLSYMFVSLLIIQLLQLGVLKLYWAESIVNTVIIILLTGLPIAGLLAWKFERSPSGFIRTTSSAAAANPFKAKQKKPLTSLPALAVLVLISAALTVYLKTQAAGLSVKPGEVSIAIIPFRNNTGNEELKHLGLGFANSVRSELSKSKQFDFISALEATTKYWNQSTDLLQMGSELKVNFLLTGLYQTAGDKIQVSVELVDAATGKGVWDMVFNEPYSDIFDIQSRIARHVLSAFELKSDLSEDSGETKNLEAYTHYLKGLEIMQSLQGDWVNRPIREFEMAISIDRDYLDAWVYMIRMKSYKAFIYKNNFPDSARLFGEEVAQLVAEFDKQFPGVWQKNIVHGAYQYYVVLDYEKGLENFEEALKYDANNELALSLAASIYKRIMKSDRALNYCGKLIKLKPSDPISWVEASVVFKSRGDYDLAIRALQNAELFGVDLRGTISGVYYSIGKPYPPDSIDRPHRFNVGKHYFIRDYKTIIHLFDTVSSGPRKSYWLAWSYWYLGQLDSARHYARLMDTTDPTQKAYQMIMLNKPNAVEQYKSDVKNILEGQDIMTIGQKTRDIVELQAILGKYEEATKTLVDFNNKHPEYGDYAYIHTNPGFDQIKKEYPPFVEALNNLKPPPPLTVEKYIKF